MPICSNALPRDVDEMFLKHIVLAACLTILLFVSGCSTGGDKEELYHEEVIATFSLPDMKRGAIDSTIIPAMKNGVSSLGNMAEFHTKSSNSMAQIIIRFKPGTDIEEARKDTETIMRSIHAGYMERFQINLLGVHRCAVANITK